MKIIAQKTDILNSNDFWNNIKNKDYITGASINIALSQDNHVLTYNVVATSSAIVNTINNSTITELENYEIEPLETTLTKIQTLNIKKDIYINITPFQTGPITDTNILEITTRLNTYIKEIIKIIDNYPDLIIHLHSVSRNIITLLKQTIKNKEIGFVVNETDLNFIDVNYYVITMNNLNDNIISLLLKASKKVILYIPSDYYLSYLYEHYLGPQSTKTNQELFTQVSVMTNYPEITYKVLKN